MHLCIIGNSHVGSLKNAWTALATKPEAISVEFFASPADSLTALELKDGVIGAADEEVAERLRLTSGGKDQIRPKDYDAFLLVGLGLRVPPIVHGISSAVVAQCCADVVSSSGALRLGLMIKSETDAAIYVSHTPLLAAETPLPAYRPYAELYPLMKSHLDAHGMELLEQPAETVLLPCNTHMRYSVEADGPIASTLPGKVNVHMNAAYGQIYLRDFFQRLSEDQKAAAPKAR